MIKVMTKAFKRDENGGCPLILEQRKVYFFGILLYCRVKEINTPEMRQMLDSLFQTAYPDGGQQQ